MTSILSLILIIHLIHLFLLTPVTAQYAQKATLFSGPHSTGSVVQLDETYSHDLNILNFENQTRSTCVTGMWLFYEHSNFNQNQLKSNSLMEFVFGPSDFCVDFNNLSGKVSSARFAGSPKDYRMDTLTLFQYSYFQGIEEYSLDDLQNLRLDEAASVIVTGISSWTLYDDHQFGGNSICISPPPSDKFTPALVHNVTSLGLDNVKSIRKGCFGHQHIFVESRS